MNAMNILIVEDDPMVARSLRRILMARGHACYEAGTVDTAVLILSAGYIEVMLLDHDLAGESGWALRDRYSNVRSVLMTGAAPEGAPSYWRKGSPVQDLYRMIEEST